MQNAEFRMLTQTRQRGGKLCAFHPVAADQFGLHSALWIL